MPTEATVAHVLVSRYADHLPLYRQPQILARQGLGIGREVLAAWVGAAAMEIVPVVRRMREILLAASRLFADETTMPVPCGSAASPVVAGPKRAMPGRSRATTGHGAVRIRRRWCFRHAPGRGAEHARALLAGYRGILQCDGYAAYETLAAANDGVTLAFCWSHARRDFIELAKGKAAPIAAAALRRVAALYATGAEIRGQAPQIRLAVRQAESRPLVEDLFAFLSAQLARLPNGSPTADAIRYAPHHRESLVGFLDDGRIELDTNTVERAIRPICLGRKNALFASVDDRGARWAAVASLVETCKLNGVDPQRCFTEVLTRLVDGWPNSRIEGK